MYAFNASPSNETLPGAGGAVDTGDGARGLLWSWRTPDLLGRREMQRLSGDELSLQAKSFARDVEDDRRLGHVAEEASDVGIGFDVDDSWFRRHWRFSFP